MHSFQVIYMIRPVAFYHLKFPSVANMILALSM